MRASKPISRRRSISRCRPGLTAETTRAATDGGFALPIAIIILFIITVLTAAAISVATQSSTSTTRDNNVKAELEAAEAGQHVASYRLSQLAPKEAQCINESEAVEPANSPCQDNRESLGNQASFRYWTTVALKAGEKCAGRTVAVTRTFQRCVTAEGSVSGVEPAVRLQARVSAPPLLPANGLFGLESVEIANNTQVLAKGGTNGKFRIGSNASVEGIALGPSGTYELGNSKSHPGTVTKQSTNFTPPPVKPANSATENSNYRIENGLKRPKASPYDESSGVTYSSATRSITVGTSLTLNGEIYNFCSLSAGIGATITVQHKPTKIFIDSPNDPGSKCSAGSGTFSMANSSNFVNANKEAAALQIYVYDEAGGPVVMYNNVTFYGVIYAPNSLIEVQNNAEIYGAMTGRAVNLKNNNTFRSEKNVEGLLGGPYQRAAWEQCTRGSGASEGC